MILIINICKEKLHELEFVKPVEEIVGKAVVKHYKDLTSEDINSADKIIICGTSLKDDEFLEHLDKFEWIKKFEKPVLGICGGAHVIGLIFGYKIKKEQEIGFYDENIKEEFLGLKGKVQVYHLHNFQVLPQVWKHNLKPIYAVLFHPEVRNKNIIGNFCEL